LGLNHNFRLKISSPARAYPPLHNSVNRESMNSVLMPSARGILGTLGWMQVAEKGHEAAKTLLLNAVADNRFRRLDENKKPSSKEP